MKHTHRLGGQMLVHSHDQGEVRSDLTYETHGYFGHVQDQVGEDMGAEDTDVDERAKRERQTGRIRTLTEPGTGTRTSTIHLGGGTARFLQGSSAGHKVTDGHAATPFPDFDTRVKMYWFYVGALAAGEYGITTQEDFGQFILGAATAAPSEEEAL